MTKAMKAAAVAALILGASSVQRASATVTITGWDFENYTGSDTLTNNPLSDLGTVPGTAMAIGMTNAYNSTTSVNTDDVITGVTGDTGSNGLADLTQIWRVRGQNPGNGWSSQAPLGSQGAVFGGSTVGFNNISVGFDWYSTKRGPAAMQLEYTNDGINWINAPITVPAADASTVTENINSANPLLAAGSYINIDPTSGGQQWVQGLTATISDPLAANNPLFAFELVNAATGTAELDAAGAALNNSSGNWRFDNISISGTTVPEPASASLIGLAGLGLLRRRRGN